MTIINHGSWTRYVPDVLPHGAPPNAMFCMRDSDGIDWYEYIYNGAPFAPGSIKITVHDGIATNAVRDESLLFPQSVLLLEVTGDATADPLEAYRGLAYDEATNTLSPPAPTVPQSVTPVQGRIALLNAGLLDSATAAVEAAGGATAIWWEYAAEWERNNSILVTMGTALGLTSTQIDQLFVAAAQIK